MLISYLKHSPDTVAPCPRSVATVRTGATVRLGESVIMVYIIKYYSHDSRDKIG